MLPTLSTVSVNQAKIQKFFDECKNYDSTLYSKIENFLTENHLTINDIRNNNNDTLMHFAIQSSNLPFIQWLLEKTPTLTQQNEDLESPFFMALNSENDQILEIFLLHYVNKVFNHSKPTDEDIEIIKQFLTKLKQNGNDTYPPPMEKAELNTKDKRENTLFKSAIEGKKSPNYIKILIVLGADPCIANVSGNTPLHHAVFFKRDVETIKALGTAAMQFAINKSNKEGKTPLFFAVEDREERLEIVRYLLQCGAQVNKINILHVAVHNRHKNIVKYLVERGGAHLDSADISGKKPLDYAVTPSHQEIVHYLKYWDLVQEINHENVGSRLSIIAKKLESLNSTTPAFNWNSITNLHGDTLCHIVVRRGNLNLLCEFIRICKADDFNAQNLAGNTPLHELCYEWHSDQNATEGRDAGYYQSASVQMFYNYRTRSSHSKVNKQGLTPSEILVTAPRFDVKRNSHTQFTKHFSQNFFSGDILNCLRKQNSIIDGVEIEMQEVGKQTENRTTVNRLTIKTAEQKQSTGKKMIFVLDKMGPEITTIINNCKNRLKPADTIQVMHYDSNVLTPARITTGLIEDELSNQPLHIIHITADEKTICDLVKQGNSMPEYMRMRAQIHIIHTPVQKPVEAKRESYNEFYEKYRGDKFIALSSSNIYEQLNNTLADILSLEDQELHLLLQFPQLAVKPEFHPHPNMSCHYYAGLYVMRVALKNIAPGQINLLFCYSALAPIAVYFGQSRIRLVALKDYELTTNIDTLNLIWRLRYDLVNKNADWDSNKIVNFYQKINFIFTAAKKDHPSQLLNEIEKRIYEEHKEAYFKIIAIAIRVDKKTKLMELLVNIVKLEKIIPSLRNSHVANDNFSFLKNTVQKALAEVLKKIMEHIYDDPRELKNLQKELALVKKMNLDLKDFDDLEEKVQYQFKRAVVQIHNTDRNISSSTTSINVLSVTAAAPVFVPAPVVDENRILRSDLFSAPTTDLFDVNLPMRFSRVFCVKVVDKPRTITEITGTGSQSLTLKKVFTHNILTYASPFFTERDFNNLVKVLNTPDAKRVHAERDQRKYLTKMKSLHDWLAHDAYSKTVGTKVMNEKILDHIRFVIQDVNTYDELSNACRADDYFIYIYFLISAGFGLCDELKGINYESVLHDIYRCFEDGVTILSITQSHALDAILFPVIKQNIPLNASLDKKAIMVIAKQAERLINLNDLIKISYAAIVNSNALSLIAVAEYIGTRANNTRTINFYETWQRTLYFQSACDHLHKGTKVVLSGSYAKAVVVENNRKNLTDLIYKACVFDYPLIIENLLKMDTDGILEIINRPYDKKNYSTVLSLAQNNYSRGVLSVIEKYAQKQKASAENKVDKPDKVISAVSRFHP